jgi:ubiquinone biosynthesis UbiH/UbiF/VisC/COQ6 family hydroxylase
MSRTDFDVVICGGGVAGATLAALLADRDLRVALVDVRRPAIELPADDFDPRVVAISPGSRQILAAAGAWQRLPPDRLGPYPRMQVCAGGQSVEFRASEHGLDQLGWIIEIPAMLKVLWQGLEQQGLVSLLAPARIREFESGHERVRITLEDGQVLRAGLLVAADGARSHLRRLAGIAVDQWHYNQKAMVTHIRTEQRNDGLAWQRFTPHGPLALLPLADGRSSIVWSLPAHLADQWLADDEAGFLDHLNEHQDSPFGPAIACSARHGLELVRRKARRLVQGRLVLLGDAARTVHPLAGQGLNLGLADAAALAELLIDKQSIKSPDPALARYQRWRLSTSELIGGGIHAINEIAHGPGDAGKGLLGLGFAAAARLWPLREAFVMRACGLDSDSPRLARSASH